MEGYPEAVESSERGVPVLINDEVWWKNAVIYCLDVETFFDSDGDGVGDFPGLIAKLDYLAGLGVTCLWLMPFFPSPSRDDGYDVTDYYGVSAEFGNLGHFVELLQHAGERGIRVITDLVINHTSIDHPWFQSARRSRDSRHRDWYVWRDEPADWPNSLVFPGKQETTWTYDEAAGQYYLHHFYSHQPDLNPHCPGVREEMARIAGFWARLGVSGFRVDAVPYLIYEGEVESYEEFMPHEFLRQLSGYLRRRRGDALLLGEVNLPPDQQRRYFGDSGDQLNMLFQFTVNQRFYLSLARRDAAPLREALRGLAPIPPEASWAFFLTNHDERTMDQLSEFERREVFDAFAPDPDMILFERGMRRRLPTMVGGDQAILRLAYTLLFALPGAPVLFYGEEIGMGENLEIEGRRAVRSPMQWSGGAAGGFSTADPSRLIRPLPPGEYGPDRVSVAAQQNREGSLLEFMERLIRIRKQAPLIGSGSWEVVDTDDTRVLCLHYRTPEEELLTFHNLCGEELRCRPDVDLGGSGKRLVEVWRNRRYPETAPDELTVELDGWGYRWLRVVPSPD